MTGRAVEGFDRVYDLVGGHGWFQWRLLLIISLQLIILTWHHIGYTFLGAIPDHWCLIEELKATNWTTEQIKELSIPRDEDSGKFKKCESYYLNYYSLAATSETFEEALAKVDFETTTTVPCKTWDFDRSIYENTIPMQFELVCKYRWMTAAIQSSYMAGGLVGTVFFGYVSDKYLGRRHTILISLTLVVLGGILASFANSYWLFIITRLSISLGVSGSMQNCFILMMEHSDIKYRAMLGLFEQVPFGIGYMILPLLAYFFRNWTDLQLSFGLLSLSVITYYWYFFALFKNRFTAGFMRNVIFPTWCERMVCRILPDSPRWLAVHRKDEEAIDALMKIAKVNKVPEPSKEELMEIIKSCQIQEPRSNCQQGCAATDGSTMTLPHRISSWIKATAANFANLMRTAEMRKRSLVFWNIFFTVAFVYYGLVFSGNLVSNPFLLVFLSGLMEVPAYTVVVPFVSKLGRRPTICLTFLITGISMITLSQLSFSNSTLRIIFAMTAKLFISSGFGIVYLLGAELYPTEMRTTGLAVGIFMGRLGSISAPFVADLLQHFGQDFPTIIFGVFAMSAGVVAIGLPETGILEMTDQLFEVEKQASGERRHSLFETINLD